MFEFLLSEWHITPDYIVDNWTDELLDLMLDKLVKRKRKEMDTIKGHKTVSAETLASRSGGMVEVKHGY